MIIFWARVNEIHVQSTFDLTEHGLSEPGGSVEIHFVI